MCVGLHSAYISAPSSASLSVSRLSETKYELRRLQLIIHYLFAVEKSKYHTMVVVKALCGKDQGAISAYAAS